MTVVSAFMLPTSPLPLLHASNPQWGEFANAMKKAGDLLKASKPDTILVYSNGWYAVLDQLWQTRKHLTGNHVDENWHEYGSMNYDISSDQEMALKCIDAANSAGISSRPVDYDGFPIDTGTIVAMNFLNPENKYPLVITSNNLYHGPEETTKIAQTAIETAKSLNRRVAIVVIGGLSGSFFRHEIDIADDHIADDAQDKLNKELLKKIEANDVDALQAFIPEYAESAKGDMGMKHLTFLLAAMNDRYASADILHYGPIYGSGFAVISFTPAA